MTNDFKFKKIIKCIDTGETIKGYINYLNSTHWENLRYEMIENKWTKCSKCRKMKFPLHLHHLSYKNLGKEIPYIDLVVLCADCHMEEHNQDLFPDNISNMNITSKKKQTKKKNTKKRKSKKSNKKFIA